MPEDIIQNLKAKSSASRKDNARFLKWLKKKKPKDLDRIAQEKNAEVFNEFDCLSCANCCKTTGPLFTERDIDRISSHLRMKPGNFIETYLKRDEENDWVLQTVPCAFLGADNYCLIYDVRPKACAQFPHMDHPKMFRINHLTQKNIEICPAAFDILNRIKSHYE